MPPALPPRSLNHSSSFSRTLSRLLSVPQFHEIFHGLNHEKCILHDWATTRNTSATAIAHPLRISFSLRTPRRFLLLKLNGQEKQFSLIFCASSQSKVVLLQAWFYMLLVSCPMGSDSFETPLGSTITHYFVSGDSIRAQGKLHVGFSICFRR